MLIEKRLKKAKKQLIWKRIKEFFFILFIKVPIIFIGFMLTLQMLINIGVMEKNNFDPYSLMLIIVPIITFLLLFSFYQKKRHYIYSLSRDELSKIKKVQLLNVSTLGHEFEIYGMIECEDTDKEIAKIKLQAEAYLLGATAVINVSIAVDNSTTTTIGSVATMPRMIEGRTSTITTYHYSGTAIKF